MENLVEKRQITAYVTKIKWERIWLHLEVRIQYAEDADKESELSFYLINGLYEPKAKLKVEGKGEDTYKLKINITNPGNNLCLPQGTYSMAICQNGCQVAKAEILAQLDKMRAGDFTDEELRAGRQALSSGYRALLDSQGQIEDFWFSQAVAGAEETPEELCARVEGVAREQVTACAQKLALDTVYYLTGKED